MSKTTVIVVVVVLVLGTAGFFIYRHGVSVGTERTTALYADSLHRTETRWRAFAAEQIKNSLNQVPPITLPGKVINMTEREKEEFLRQVSAITSLAQRNTDSLEAVIVGLAEPKEFTQSDILYEDELVRTEWSLYAYFRPLDNEFTARPTINIVHVKGLPRDTITVVKYVPRPFLEQPSVAAVAGKSFVSKSWYGGAKTFLRMNFKDVCLVPQVGYETDRKVFAGVELQYQF